MKTLAAFTEISSLFPQYFNASLDGDEVVVIVRGQPKSVDGILREGPTVSIRIPREVFDEALGGLAE